MSLRWFLMWMSGLNAGMAAWQFAQPLSEAAPILGALNVGVAVLCGLQALSLRGDS